MLKNIRMDSLREEEIGLLPEVIRPGEQRARYKIQQEGKAVYLIAWEGKRFVGHLLLTWAGDRQEPMVSNLERCPHISNLLVEEEYRSQGIGSSMLEMIEQVVRERGYKQIGLGVGVDNERARALYERLGYDDSGLGEYVEWWTSLSETGDEFLHMEVCEYWVKRL